MYEYIDEQVRAKNKWINELLEKLEYVKTRLEVYENDEGLQELRKEIIEYLEKC